MAPQPPFKRPDWNRLFEIAVTQEGHFTTVQAGEAGYSRPLIAKYLANGKFLRVRRGVYRLVHYPAGEMEDLVTYWLWSDRAGVFSHETALSLHQLSDALPARVHLTLPRSWRNRRIQVPDPLVVHYADLPEDAQTWIGSVRATTAAQTIRDSEAIGVSLELIKQALDEGLARGLFAEAEVVDVVRTIKTAVLRSPDGSSSVSQPVSLQASSRTTPTRRGPSDRRRTAPPSAVRGVRAVSGSGRR